MVIEFIYDLIDFMLSDGGQVPMYREVLPDQASGILVQPILPRCIRMRGIDTGIKVIGHAFVISIFPTSVIADGMHPVPAWGKSVHDGVPDSRCRLVEDGVNDRIQQLTRDKGAAATFTNHGISLPVTETPTGIDSGRAFIDRYLAGDTPAPVVAAIALAPNLLAAQEPVQVAA